MSQDSNLEVEIVRGIDSVPEGEWDSLIEPDDPFTTHAFLSTLEASGSATSGTGWLPLHLLCRSAGTLIGATPLYLKNHSYGEYIFDWSWAQSAQRAGIPYYPKLLCGIPFTPATGRRLLVAPGKDRGTVQRALLGGMLHCAREVKAHSLHILFCTEQEWTELGELPGISPRVTHQFHWTHPGVDNFEEWLMLMRSRRRKEVRRERRIAEQLGVEVRVVRGDLLTSTHWEALESFYRDTVQRKWGQPYLLPEFFQQAQMNLAPYAVAFLAIKDGEVQAGALAFQRGQNLYGRYWGCRPGYEHLHFELCYHRPIELCLEQGWTRFEAGAQGEHKLSRGLLPSATHSLHWIRNPGLARAVDRSNRAETEHTRQLKETLASHGPFHRTKSE